MPMSDNRTKYKRTNLFLLRVWCDEPEPDGDGDAGSEEKPNLKWHGRVQRTVSGEAYNFEDKEALLEVLECMLYKGRPGFEQIRSSRSSKRTSSGIDIPGGKHTDEANG